MDPPPALEESLRSAPLWVSPWHECVVTGKSTTFLILCNSILVASPKKQDLYGFVCFGHPQNVKSKTLDFSLHRRLNPSMLSNGSAGYLFFLKCQLNGMMHHRGKKIFTPPPTPTSPKSEAGLKGVDEIWDEMKSAVKKKSPGSHRRMGLFLLLLKQF